MPEHMGRAPARASGARPAHRLDNDHRDRTVVREGTKRSARADEQGVSVGLGATVLDIGDDRIANLLSQWQQCLTTALPCNVDAGPFQSMSPK